MNTEEKLSNLEFRINVKFQIFFFIGGDFFYIIKQATCTFIQNFRVSKAKKQRIQTLQAYQAACSCTQSKNDTLAGYQT